MATKKTNPNRSRRLVQWIGHSDLRWLAKNSESSRQKELLSELGGELDRIHSGPTHTLLQNESFEEIVFLSNYKKKWNDWLVESFKHLNAKLIKVALSNPANYEGIYEIADRELAKLSKRKDASDFELCLHLSPGTPQMSAVWLLLGKTKFPAKFLESYRSESYVTTVPFDLTLDVIPEILRNSENSLAHLAAESPKDVVGFEDIVGESSSIRNAVGRAKRAAMLSVSVLLLGESGTGKEMFAKAIRMASPRKDKEFISINCASLSEELLRSELFGHSKGAFTGATETKKGAFERADNGTVFLDEVGECDLATQAQLLRVLQPDTKKGLSIRTIQRLGDGKEKEVDVRIIAATNQNLLQKIKDGSFREDLYYRLVGITVTLPSLRERRSDIPELSEVLLEQINEQFSKQDDNYKHKKFSAAAKSFVKRHDWPGNVRQLYHVIGQAAILSENEIGRVDMESALGEMPSATSSVVNLASHPLGDGFNLKKHLETVHREYLVRAMEEAGGVKAEAARLLGMNNYQTLDPQLKKFKIKYQPDKK